MVFTDAQRRQLAEKARALGRRALHELGTILTPDTLSRWHRELVAQKWTFIERRRLGRPRIRAELVPLVVRMARENRGWGYTRTSGNRPLTAGRERLLRYCARRSPGTVTRTRSRTPVPAATAGS